MDLREKIEDIVEKLKADPQLLNKFQSDPIKALENLTGLDLPDDQLEPLIAGVKAKLAAGNASDLLGKLGKLI